MTFEEKLNKYKLHIEEFSDIDPSDYPDFSDAFVTSACWEVTPIGQGPVWYEYLTDDELETLTSDYTDLYQEDLYEQLF